MNFLSSHPSVGGTVEWDGLQLQARTAPGSGRCLHRCTLVLCPCIAAGGGTEYEQGTTSEGYDQGTGADTQSRWVRKRYRRRYKNNRRGPAIGDSPS